MISWETELINLQQNLLMSSNEMITQQTENIYFLFRPSAASGL